MNDITAKIEDIKYEASLPKKLKECSMDGVNINTAPTAFMLRDGSFSFAISKWVSPKRTRSYPYERVYNTLNASKRITVIPIIKDEGVDGDRDFLQWDTISLMSLLDVYVIFAYYHQVERNRKTTKQKITAFKFDNEYVISKIKEIETYHSSALHWNTNELKNNLQTIVGKARESYLHIERETGVTLHDIRGIDEFIDRLKGDISTFRKFSRERAEEAQRREVETIQPKEKLSTLSKAKIIIHNYLGGEYFFTTDEIDFDANCIYLIEGKHSNKGLLPSESDIKDGLLKMMLYANLSDVKIDGINKNSRGVLKLTSTRIVGEVSSDSSTAEQELFFERNQSLFSRNNMKKKLIEKLFTEAVTNRFTVKIEGLLHD
jgi:hypothetical protein